MSTGQYQVQLPQQLPMPELGESRSTAVRRFLSNERNLKRRGKWEEFHKALLEYPALKHAECVPAEELYKPPGQTFYMPVHGIIKESSSTTSLRAVFDASARTSTGVSLNDQLMTGPTLHPPLTAVLTHFRTHYIAFNGDISKMFRGVVLHPSERDYHRFLLRSDQGALEDWRMCRLTFGVKSSPYIATQVLQQAASEYAHKYPAASRCLLNDFYVDDCLTGAPTLLAAQNLQHQICSLFEEVGMLLRKWRSNSSAFIQATPEELCDASSKEVAIAKDPTDHGKALCVHWDTQTDEPHIVTPDIPSSYQPNGLLHQRQPRLTISWDGLVL